MTDVALAVAELADDIAVFVRGGDSIEGAVRRLLRQGAPQDLVDQARTEYERKVGIIRDLKDPGSLVRDKLERGYWYDGPKESDTFWPSLRGRLMLTIGAPGVAGVDTSSTRVVSLLQPPGMPAIATRGLVLGYVQSGKTTNFMSVISKAADVGYRMFIVLSGITDNLRSQTQERLEDVLIGDLERDWFLLTDRDSDFHRSDNAPNLLSRTDHRLIAVVKKNPYRLRRLLRWLESAGQATLEQCPILLIDDEADQASINVGRVRTSKINGLIRQIISKPKTAYVAYTATPFANLLIDPDNYEDLYPRDFIVDLPAADEYFGTARIFGREPLTPEEADDGVGDGLDMIRHVDLAEVADVQPPRGRGTVVTWHPTAAPSLRLAVAWFLIATAARRARGNGIGHSSMLIHTSMLAAAHRALSVPVQQTVDEYARRLIHDPDTTLAELQGIWELERERVPPESVGEDTAAWEDVAAQLPGVAAAVRIVIDNYRSDERLSYPDAEPVTVIVIGGNTLSRGLTLEGLVCSYFVRSASAYDTLLQMGRWFGFRRGYADLTRVWMTADLESWFFDLATVEEEVRREIRRYEDEGIRPDQLPVRIRTHPSMAVTSAAKMRSAKVAEMSFSRSRQQTILFNHKDLAWLDDNIAAVRKLVGDCRSSEQAKGTANRDGRPMFRDVPSDVVVRFLAVYRFHERAYQMRSDLLSEYIGRQMSQGFLSTWNVVVMSHPAPDNGEIDLGLDHSVNLIQRARIDMPGLPHANIKSLVSTVDRVGDVDTPIREIAASAGGEPTDKTLLAFREAVIGPVGLLCIYPVSKDSTPRSRGQEVGVRTRKPLDAVQHVMGLGLFFPEARGAASNVSYVSADLSAELVDDETELAEDIALIDYADEVAGESEPEPAAPVV